MLEGVPGEPYTADLNRMAGDVEASMAERRRMIEALVDGGAGEKVVTLAVFPRLGCPDFTRPAADPDPASAVTRSLFWPDAAVHPHPRYRHFRFWRIFHYICYHFQDVELHQQHLGKEGREGLHQCPHLQGHRDTNTVHRRLFFARFEIIWLICIL